jgi:hypothetical protein
MHPPLLRPKERISLNRCAEPAEAEQSVARNRQAKREKFEFIRGN